MRKPKVKIVYEELGDAPPNGKNGTPFGECEKVAGEISIDPRQSASEMLDSEVHELCHAAWKYMSEASVHRGASIIAEALWKLGYRKKK